MRAKAQTTALESYRAVIYGFSRRIVEAQRPIRVLEAVKWPRSVAEALKKLDRTQALPLLTADDYRNENPLGYDPLEKQRELLEIAKDIERDLDRSDPLRGLLIHIVEQYIDVIEMLKNRGTKRFWELSRKLYGSPRDPFDLQEKSVLDLGRNLSEILTRIDGPDLGLGSVKNLSAEHVVDTLNDRFRICFPGDRVKAKISDGIIADAAAGGDTVKIRSDSSFSARDVDVLEVHEGWVHVGTTQNGNAQSTAQWLSKGPPRVASTQEGLAVLMEILTFRSYPRRAKQINDRILAVDHAESGADLFDLLEFYRVSGYSEEDAMKNAKRIFRGSHLGGGAPFTKDISYCRGFFEVYHFMRSAIRAGRPELVPFLFAGKMHVDDVPLLYQKYQEGVIDPPVFLPPPFRDLNGIAVWMSFSASLTNMDGERIQERYERLFQLYL